MHYKQSYMSPYGSITLASDGENLIGLWFDGQKYDAATLDKRATAEPLPIFDAASAWLDKYFKGENPPIDFPLAPIGSPFRQMIWDLLLQIPYGQTTTYGELARKAAILSGKNAAAQAVGGAVGHNPISIIIPCHRVVGSTGSLTGYAGGIEKKESLLTIEGALK